MKNHIILIVFVIIAGIFLSGCVSKSADSPKEEKLPASTSSPTTTQASQSVEQNKINELETKINSMQQQINTLEARVDRVDLLKPSEKKLIPQIPFRIEIYTAEWQSPTKYEFKENGVAELIDADFKEYATYKIFMENNTIKINSPKYKFFGLVLYDDCVASVYENGWTGWVYKYKAFPPKYNPLTQKYGLN